MTLLEIALKYNLRLLPCFNQPRHFHLWKRGRRTPCYITVEDPESACIRIRLSETEVIDLYEWDSNRLCIQLPWRLNIYNKLIKAGCAMIQCGELEGSMRFENSKDVVERVMTILNPVLLAITRDCCNLQTPTVLMIGGGVKNA